MIFVLSGNILGIGQAIEQVLCFLQLLHSFFVNLIQLPDTRIIHQVLLLIGQIIEGFLSLFYLSKIGQIHVDHFGQIIYHVGSFLCQCFVKSFTNLVDLLHLGIISHCLHDLFAQHIHLCLGCHDSVLVGCGNIFSLGQSIYLVYQSIHDIRHLVQQIHTSVIVIIIKQTLLFFSQVCIFCHQIINIVYISHRKIFTLVQNPQSFLDVIDYQSIQHVSIVCQLTHGDRIKNSLCVFSKRIYLLSDLSDSFLISKSNFCRCRQSIHFVIQLFSDILHLRDQLIVLIPITTVHHIQLVSGHLADAVCQIHQIVKLLIVKQIGIAQIVYPGLHIFNYPLVESIYSFLQLSKTIFVQQLLDIF